MASVDFKKLKSAGEVKAMIRHSETEERLKHEHKNVDIDKSRTEENLSFTRLSYKEVCEKYDNRIKELDETTNKNRRKDRVTCFGLTMTAAEGMTIEQSKDFFFDTIKLMSKQFGAENMVCAYAHYDEIHSYMDNTTKEIKESRPHLHVYVIPEVNGQLNGREFSSKKAMIKLNKEIDELCREKYNCRFMTGEEPKKLSVEELKSLGNIEQQKRIKERDDLIAQLETERKKLTDFEIVREKYETELTNTKQKLTETQNELKKYKAEMEANKELAYSFQQNIGEMLDIIDSITHTTNERTIKRASYIDDIFKASVKADYMTLEEIRQAIKEINEPEHDIKRNYDYDRF